MKKRFLALVITAIACLIYTTGSFSQEISVIETIKSEQKLSKVEKQLKKEGWKNCSGTKKLSDQLLDITKVIYEVNELGTPVYFFCEASSIGGFIKGASLSVDAIIRAQLSIKINKEISVRILEAKERNVINADTALLLNEAVKNMTLSISRIWNVVEIYRKQKYYEVKKVALCNIEQSIQLAKQSIIEYMGKENDAEFDKLMSAVLLVSNN